MLKRFSKYICQSVAAMIGQSVYILADTFFISFNSSIGYSFYFIAGFVLGIGLHPSTCVHDVVASDYSIHFQESCA